MRKPSPYAVIVAGLTLIAAPGLAHSLNAVGWPLPVVCAFALFVLAAGGYTAILLSDLTLTAAALRPGHAPRRQNGDQR